MKISKSQLKRIIKEELENVIQENKLPENAVENPESYCIKPGNSYLVDEGGAGSGWATLYVVTQGSKAMALKTIKISEKQKAVLLQK